jgi:hypothetical protein
MSMDVLTTTDKKSLLRELGQLMLELELVSQVSASQLSTSRSSDEEIGGKRPPGGLDYAGDYDDAYPQKTKQYFAYRLRHTRDWAEIEQITAQARKAVDRCKRRPPPTDAPEWGSSDWKRWVVEHTELTHSQVAEKYNCPRQYIYKIRREYGVLEGDAHQTA